MCHVNSSGVDNTDEKGWYWWDSFFTINILKIVWRLDKAFSFIYLPF